MKGTIVQMLTASALLMISACGDKKVAASDVPQPVISAFNAKYVGATDVDWTTEKEDGNMLYEAHFKTGDQKREAEFKTDGTFVKEEAK